MSIEVEGRSENEPDNAPTCQLCGTAKSTHRCHSCARFVCEDCLAPGEAPHLSKLLTDEQTDAFFLSIQSTCRSCGEMRKG